MFGRNPRTTQVDVENEQEPTQPRSRRRRIFLAVPFAFALVFATLLSLSPVGPGAPQEASAAFGCISMFVSQGLPGCIGYGYYGGGIVQTWPVAQNRLYCNVWYLQSNQWRYGGYIAHPNCSMTFLR